MMSREIIVVGGGAAGMMAAISAAENGGYRLIVKYKNFYLYEMYYNGTTVTGYARVI